MIKFALLASGSKGNCCLVRNCETSIVIDCGSTKRYLLSCFERLQYDYQNTSALFVTHTHSDHISQLKMFKEIDTYSMSELDTNHFTQVQAFDKVELNTLNITAIPTSHDTKDSCGYIVESDSEKLVYMTDTGYISELIKPYLINADYYIFESNHDIEMLMETNRPMMVKQRIIGDFGHLCNEDCANTLASLIGINTKEIILAHLSEEGNSKEKAKSVLIETLAQKKINYKNIRIVSAPQFDIVVGGKQH